jgi:hypothetical protein
VSARVLREVVVSIVHTEEGEHIHIISMRKATRRERKILLREHRELIGRGSLRSETVTSRSIAATRRPRARLANADQCGPEGAQRGGVPIEGLTSRSSGRP